MRNLKRTLSLALAAVMLMGMMVIGAGAASKDFTDAGEIKNVEAVDVMVALGVLQGGDKGDFQPNSILTREQAAKIICYMLLGTESADKLTTNSTVFKDVAADRWSAPYIGYCVNLGILAGDGNGNFFPEGKLNGAAFAKMLLVALGYDPAIEKYVGSDWMINVASDAIEAGITPKGLVLSDDLSRQDAAQMALQTLTANMVKYDNKGTVINNADGSSVIIGASSAEAIEVVETTGAAGNNYDRRDSGAAGVGYKQFCEKYFPDLTKDDGEDDFGRVGYTWYYGTHGTDEVGTYAEAANYTVVVSKASKDVEYWAEQANKKLTFVTTGENATTFAGNGVAAPANKATVLNVGDIVEFFVDGNNIEKVIVTRYTADVITDVDTDVKKDDAEDGVTAYITFETAGTFNNTDIAGYNADTYEKDAVVALVEGTNDDGDTVIKASYVCKSVEGAISAFSSTNRTYTMDGTKYTMTGTAADEINGKVDFKEGTYKLYLDANGYVIKTEVVEGAVAIGDVFYIASTWTEESKAYNETTTTFFAQVVYLDGTVKEIELAKAAGDIGDTSDDADKVKAAIDTLKASGKFFTDAKTDVEDTDDVSVTLSDWDNSDTDYSVDDTIAFTGADSEKIKTDDTKVQGYYVNKDTTYVVVEGTGSKLAVTTKTGGLSFTPASGDEAYVIYTTENGSKVASYIVIKAAKYKGAETGDYFYIVDKTDFVNVDGGKQYTAYDMAGKEITIVIDKNETVNDETFYTYVEKDGVYSDLQAVDGQIDKATYTSYYGDLLTTSAFGDYDAADAVIVDAHDTDGDYNKSITTLAAMQAAKKAGYVVTMDVIVDESGDNKIVEYIVVTSVIKGNSVVVTPGEAATPTEVTAPADGGTIVLKGSVKAGMPEDVKDTMGNKEGTDFSIVRITMPTEFNVDGVVIKQTNAALSKYYSEDPRVEGNVKTNTYNWASKGETPATFLVMVLNGGTATLEVKMPGEGGATYTYVVDGSGLNLITE